MFNKLVHATITALTVHSISSIKWHETVPVFIKVKKALSKTKLSNVIFDRVCTNASETLERFIETVNWNIIKCVACICLFSFQSSSPQKCPINHSAETDALQFMGVFNTEVGGATMAHTSGFAACTDGSDSEETTGTSVSSLTLLRLTLI